MTKIEWTHVPDGSGGFKKGETINPLVGCTEISPACRNCYAAGIAHRSMSPQHRGLTVKRANGSHWNGQIREVPSHLAKPLTWRKPRGIFWGSMTDLAHESRMATEEGRRYLAACFGVMAATPQHTHLVLTKRPGELRRWFDWLHTMASQHMTGVFADEVIDRCISSAVDILYPAREGKSADLMIDRWNWSRFGEYAFEACDESEVAPINRKIERMRNGPQIDEDAWPLRNVWVGCTAEDQTWLDRRIDDLLAIPAAVHYLSVEPMLGPVTLPPSFLERGSQSWVIAGGESGHGARPPHIDWFRRLRDQCIEAGVPFLFKQWGEFAPWVTEEWFTRGGAERHPHTWVANDGRSGDCWIVDDDGNWSNWTGDPPLGVEAAAAIMSRVGKAEAGRMLDGRTWDEFPDGSI